MKRRDGLTGDSYLRRQSLLPIERLLPLAYAFPAFLRVTVTEAVSDIAGCLSWLRQSKPLPEHCSPRATATKLVAITSPSTSYAYAAETAKRSRSTCLIHI